jgi:photosystem II stability/assembly factor-like uncharacterized protein
MLLAASCQATGQPAGQAAGQGAGSASGQPAAQATGTAPASGQESASGAASHQAPGTAGAEAAGFHVVGASFLSPDAGWVLGQAGCAGCAALLRTADGGRHWSALAPPPAPIGYDATNSAQTGMDPKSVTDVSFADARDGFLYGPAMLVTHDGGQSWTRPPLPPVTSFAQSGGFAYAITEATGTSAATGLGTAPYVLWRAPVATGQWSRLRLPPAAVMPSSWDGGLQIYAEGTAVVLLQGGFQGVEAVPGHAGRLWAGVNGTGWQPRAVPCRPPGDGGATALSMARAHPDAWLVDCYDNEQSSQAQQTQHHLYGTANGGLTWVRLADPAATDTTALLADNGAGRAFLALSGITNELRATFDGGLHWQTVLSVPDGNFEEWADLAFLTPEDGYVVTASFPENLFRTTDAGRTWQPVSTEAPGPPRLRHGSALFQSH